jgi:hypothetical protein
MNHRPKDESFEAVYTKGETIVATVHYKVRGKYRRETRLPNRVGRRLLRSAGLKWETTRGVRIVTFSLLTMWTHSFTIRGSILATKRLQQGRKPLGGSGDNFWRPGIVEDEFLGARRARRCLDAGVKLICADVR